MLELKPNHYELWHRRVGPLLKSTRESILKKGLYDTILDAAKLADGSAVWAAAITIQVERALARVTSWSEILEQPEVREIEHLLIKLFTPIAKEKAPNNWQNIVASEVMTQLMLVTHTALFRKHEQQSYVVSEALAERLLQTELRGLTADDLRLPQASVYIEVPASLGLRINHHIDGWMPLKAAYIYESLTETGRLTNEPSPHRRWFLYFVAGNEINGVTDYFLSSSIGMLEGAPLDECLARTLERFTARGMDAEVQAEWMRVFTWLMNVVVYTTWPDAEREHIIASPEARKLLNRLQRAPKGHPRRRAILDELKTTEARMRTVLGPNVIQLERHALSEDALRAANLPSSFVTVRTLVQGHWRRLEPGAGKPWKEKKLLWIEPFWRGPQDGPTHPSTIHEVKG